MLESKNVYFSKYLSSLLFCKRDLGFVFVSSKRGFLDHKNVILLESKNLHFSKGDKLFSDFYWGEGDLYTCYIKSGVHVFQSILSKPPLLNFIPFVSFSFFFVDLSDKVAEK